MDIQQGNSDGVELSGSKAALLLDIPSTFAEGNITARLFLDDASSDDQRRELEAIFQGRKGGVWGALAPAFTAWLPTTVTTISIEWGDTSTITVGDVGRVTAVPRKDQQGQPTLVEGAEAQLALQLGPIQPSHSAGTRWADPEMRAWDGKSGVLSTMNWSG
jgi:hypothetical protein